jgi:hypothetical protein
VLLGALLVRGVEARPVDQEQPGANAEPDRAPLGPPPGGPENRENVQDRPAAHQTTGFGQLWYKRLAVRFLPGEPAVAVMESWKAHLQELWPESGTVFVPRRWFREGDLLGLDVAIGPLTLSSGVVVFESSETALRLVPPEGHMFAGWVELSTRDCGAEVEASVTVEMRAGDPLYEVGLALGGHRREELFWAEMLRNLARRYGSRPPVHLLRRRVDAHRHWRYAANVRYNAMLNTWARKAKRLLGRGS